MNRPRAGSLGLIASPSPEARRRWVRGIQAVHSVHEVADRAALEQSLRTLAPAVLVLDMSLPHFRLEDMAVLQRLSPSTKILLLAGPPDDREAIAALKAGARGYHSAEIVPPLLTKAVQTIQDGGIWVGRKVIPHLLEELTFLTRRREKGDPARTDGRLDRLTSRERDVAKLIGNGASNKEIASRLNITERTVKAHLTAIFSKLGLSDRLRLALFVAERNGTSR